MFLRTNLAGTLLAAAALLAGCGPSPAPEASNEASVQIHGRFRRVRGDSLSDEQRSRIDALESVGYVSGSREAATERIITRHRRDAVAPGLNFFTSGNGPYAYLMAMDGSLLHRWEAPVGVVFPELELPEDNANQHFWRRAYLYPNGDALGIFEGIGIFKVDRVSKLLWSRANNAHHDMDVLPDGKIAVLTRKAHVVARVHPTEPVLEDFVSVLDPDGVLLEEVSILECFENSPYQIRSLHEGELEGDIFHTNGLQVLRPENHYSVPWMRSGLLLVSIRTISAIAVVDFSAKTVVKAFKGDFLLQHDPRALSNGNILLFDNHGRPGASRVLELEPQELTVVWEYAGSADMPFFSDTCGTAARLANGNTLVTESDNGRAFEVDGEGEIAWEFYNPFRGGERGEFIATLFELRRLPDGYCEGWLGAGN
ncbi:MAG TPA: arylsulfotransferase family protein [Candidatus Krumholzibacteria bacterium]|jgi:hypothetical protein